MTRTLGINKRRLGRDTQQRMYILRSILQSVTKYGFCSTNLIRLKVSRPFIEKLITKSKTYSLHNFRNIMSYTHSLEVTKSLFKLGLRYKDRNGGYTSIKKLSLRRKGDYSKIGRIELV
jgi:large subunit ribosomal protein L17